MFVKLLILALFGTIESRHVEYEAQSWKITNNRTYEITGKKVTFTDRDELRSVLASNGVESGLVDRMSMEAALPSYPWVFARLCKLNPRCPLPTFGERSDVSMAFYTRTFSQHEFIGYLCRGEITLYEKIEGKGNYPEIKGTGYYSLPREECESMVEHLQTRSGRQLHLMNASYWATRESLDMNKNYRNTLEKVQIDVDNYHLVQVKLKLDRYTGFVVSDDTKFTENCSYTKYSCKSDDGIFMWNIKPGRGNGNPDRRCSFPVHRSDFCQISKHLIFCPSMGMAIVDRDHHRKKPCHHSVGHIRIKIDRDPEAYNIGFSDMDLKPRTNIISTFSELYTNYTKLNLIERYMKGIEVITSCSESPYDVIMVDEQTAPQEPNLEPISLGALNDEEPNHHGTQKINLLDGQDEEVIEY